METGKTQGVALAERVSEQNSIAHPKRKAKAPAHGLAKADAPAKGVKGVRGAAILSQAELGVLVAAELANIRTVLREVSAAIVERLDGEAAILFLYLEGEPLPGERAILPNARTLRAVLAALAQLKVKPRKGRVKDLARIEFLLTTLSDRMPPGV